MPTPPFSISRQALLPLLGLLLTSCIGVGDFSRSATRYNEAVEEAQNRMLLLNVVRSDLHRPMYITDLSKVTGNIKLDLNTGGLETDYGPYSNTLLKGKSSLTSGKLTPSIDYAQNPTFDVNVLSTQEFMNGFLKPTSKETVAYYWEQRWEQELLLYLFVHSVRIRTVDDTSEPEEYYENYPLVEANELPRVDAFGHWVTKFLETKPLFVKKEIAIGPCLAKEQVSDLDDLVAATKEGLSLSEVEPGYYQLQQSKSDLNLTSEDEAALEREQEAICKNWKEAKGTTIDLAKVAEKAAKDCEDKLRNEGDQTRRQYIARVCAHRRETLGLIEAKKFECSSPCPSPAHDRVARAQVSAQYAELERGKRVRKEATLFLRSPEGMLYYLGELMRVEAQAGLVPEICVEGKLEPLFVAFEESGPNHRKDWNCPATVSVRYDGSEFIIPGTKGDFTPPVTGEFRCTKSTVAGSGLGDGHPKYLKGLDKLHCSPGRSMQALSLLTQLISLQKSAKDTPTTSVIRAISQ